MYSRSGRFGTTSASLWTTTVSKPFGAISRAIAATSAEGQETRILGDIRFLWDSSTGTQRKREMAETRCDSPGFCCAQPELRDLAPHTQVSPRNVSCFTYPRGEVTYEALP